METDNVNARVTYLVDDWSRVIHERDFHTVREAEDWLFEEMKVAYRRGAEEVFANALTGRMRLLREKFGHKGRG